MLNVLYVLRLCVGAGMSTHHACAQGDQRKLLGVIAQVCPFFKILKQGLSLGWNYTK